MRFNALTKAQAWTKCEPFKLAVMDDDYALATDDEVGSAEVEPNGCAYIIIKASFATDPTYARLFAALGVDPFVAVASHEIGHVLGLGHAADTDRSVMGAEVNLTRNAYATCEDVASLGLLWKEPLPCREPR